MVFSDLFRLLRKSETVEGIFNDLVDAVGAEGTLIIPVFDWLPSALGRYAAGRDDAVMTTQKVYKFAVFGAFAQGDFYGEYSPFHTLRVANGKLLATGLPFGKGMPFYHYVEVAEDVDYRYWKSMGDYSLFVREKGVKTNTAPMDELLWDDGQWEGEINNRAIPARTVYRYTERVINEGRAEGMLWTV